MEQVTEMTESTNQRNYLPAVATLLLAALFPFYWGNLFLSSSTDWYLELQQDLQNFSAFDVLFIVIGILEIYVLWSLRKALTDQLNVASAKIMLWMMIASVVVFHASVLVDVSLGFKTDPVSPISMENITDTVLLLAFSALFIYAICGGVFSIVLLFRHSQIPTLLKVFSVLLMISCLFQLTIILAALNIILFPVALLILAVYFVKNDPVVEVV